MVFNTEKYCAASYMDCIGLAGDDLVLGHGMVCTYSNYLVSLGYSDEFKRKH